jgi:hypothetical protein
MRQLAGFDFHCILKEREPQARTQTILIAPQAGMRAETLEVAVLSAVGHACADKGPTGGKLR